MGKRNKIKKPSLPKKGKQVSQEAQLPKLISSDDEHPSFRFTYTDKNSWTLSEWSSSEINVLIEGLKKIEKYGWAQIKTHGAKRRGESVGTGYKLIGTHPSLPEYVPKDVKLSEMRIDREKRIFGFREGAVCYIIWFDRSHSVCPE